MTKKHKKNLRAPPETSDFSVLFHFILDNGVGNRLNRNGDPVSWTDNTLESAFTDSKYSVDQRSIQNWRSGNNLPGRKNIQALARVISGNDELLKRQWADKLLLARRVKVQERKRHTKPKIEAPSINQNIDQTDNPHHPTLPRFNVSTPRNFTVGAFVGIAATLALIGLLRFADYLREDETGVKVVDLRFCDLNGFSEDEHICQHTVSNFEYGTQKIYVSFKLEGMEYGHPFERKWYRNGEEFLKKRTYYDDAWSDYTYIFNSHGHPEGDYVMRIIIDDKVTTGRFTVMNKN